MQKTQVDYFLHFWEYHCSAEIQSFDKDPYFTTKSREQKQLFCLHFYIVLFNKRINLTINRVSNNSTIC